MNPLTANPLSAAAIAEAPARAVLGLDFRLVLDQIDYGIVVAESGNVPRFANKAARAALAAGRIVAVDGGRLACAEAADTEQLGRAVRGACAQGLRSFLLLGRDAERLAISVLPLAVEGAPAMAMLAFGRRQVCETLTSLGYARCHDLTAAESRVLELLCAGAAPDDIARRLQVAVSTIRSQISSIRAKTGARSVGALVREVAMLPPMAALLGSVG